MEEQTSLLVDLIGQYGFPAVMMAGLGYFVYFVWNFISEEIEPQIEKMHFALIRVIDQTRMLDQDLIRLQQKVNVVLEYRERQKLLEEGQQNASKNKSSK